MDLYRDPCLISQVDLRSRKIMPSRKISHLTIGDLAARTGLAVSAIRCYAIHRIVAPLRNGGGHRRNGRAHLRRLSFAMIAQRLDFPLAVIAAHLDKLPANKAPGQADWARISTGFRADIDAHIANLLALRDSLDGCIGSGCLSLDRCAIWNPADCLASQGPGPHQLLRDMTPV